MQGLNEEAASLSSPLHIPWNPEVSKQLLSCSGLSPRMDPNCSLGLGCSGAGQQLASWEASEASRGAWREKERCPLVAVVVEWGIEDRRQPEHSSTGTGLKVREGSEMQGELPPPSLDLGVQRVHRSLSVSVTSRGCLQISTAGVLRLETSENVSNQEFGVLFSLFWKPEC